MKKEIVIVLSVLSLVLTFVLSEFFSIYHFGNIPTLLTSLYLLSIFSVLDYLFISITYIVTKKINKQKLGIKRIIGLMLLFISLLFILFFLIVVDIDWLNWYINSSPFYINVIVRGVEFLLPSIILIVSSLLLLKKS